MLNYSSKDNTHPWQFKCCDLRGWIEVVFRGWQTGYPVFLQNPVMILSDMIFLQLLGFALVVE